MNLLSQELEIKKLLKRTWSAFFSRYGRFFSTQLKAIPLVLDRKNVLIKAPPGTGKTEAVMAPLIENLKKEAWKDLSILYIVPTRALANDTIKRLAAPLEELEIKIKRKTGDFPYEFKDIRDCSVLVITPESLDSLLCKSPAAFYNLKAIVLDELHLLDNTVRGDQLRILLSRIRNLPNMNKRIQYCALSATFENAEEQALRYFSPVSIIEESNKKTIDYKLFPEDWNNIISFLKRESLKKVIIFCNSRAEAEQIANKINIPPFKNKVFVHHGSLNRAERLRVEEIINESKVAICVATMTLEFGIDIGDIDAIGLYKPPLSIASLLQRIGRGCRRRKDKSIAFGIYTNDLDYVSFISLFSLASEAAKDDLNYFPKYSVIIQQIFSLLKQKKYSGILYEELRKIMIPFISSEVYLKAIIEKMKANNYIEIINQIIYPTEKAINICNLPGIHSNIGVDNQKAIELRIIDEDKPLGKIPIQQLMPGESFLFGGSKWKLLNLSGDIGYVISSLEKTDRVKKFLPTGTPLLSFKQANYIKNFYYGEFPDNAFLLEKSEDACIIFHFMGKLYGELLAKAYSMKYKIRIIDAEGFCFYIPKYTIFPLYLEEKDFVKTINRYYRSLSRLINVGRFFNQLPEELQRDNVFQAIDLSFLQEYLKKASIIPIKMKD